MEDLRFKEISQYNVEVLKVLAAVQCTSQLQKIQNLSDGDLKEAWENVGPWFNSELIMCLYEEMRRRRLL
jgi:hypothetical protein